MDCVVHAHVDRDVGNEGNPSGVLLTASLKSRPSLLDGKSGFIHWKKLEVDLT